MKRIVGIYGIRNTANGKWYIGQSNNVENRKKIHFCMLRGGYHSNPYLQSAYKKYGADNFEFRVFEETGEDMLDIRERVWITHYKSTQEQYGYNLESGGHLLKHHSVVTKRKMSVAKKGNPWSPARKKTQVLVTRALLSKTRMTTAQMEKLIREIKKYEYRQDLPNQKRCA